MQSGTFSADSFSQPSDVFSFGSSESTSSSPTSSFSSGDHSSFGVQFSSGFDSNIKPN
jgi:hypothetical protein